MTPLTPARHTFIALAAIAFVSVGCATMKVNSYAMRGLDISRYHSFDWGPADTFSTGDPRLDNNRFFDERVRAEVEKHLAAKGLEKTTGVAPDLLVHYHASVTQELDLRDFDQLLESSYDDCEEDECRPFVYDAGTLFVDLVDPQTKTLVWRGWAQSNIDGVVDDQEWMEARINESIAQILQRLPTGF